MAQPGVRVASHSGQVSFSTMMLLLLLAAVIQLGSCILPPGTGHSNPLHLNRQTPRDGATDVATLSSGIQRPPQLPFVYNVTVDSIQQLGSTIIASLNSTIQQILNGVKPETATFQNTVLPFLQWDNEYRRQFYPLQAIELGTKPENTDARDETQVKIKAALADAFTTEPFFQLVDSVYQSNKDTTSLNEEDHIVLAAVWSEFAKRGLNIPAGPQRELFETMTERISAAALEFSYNLTTVTYLYFTAEELEGVPADLIKSYLNATGENVGKLQIDVNSVPDILDNCVNETTRYTAIREYYNQVPENVALLQEIVQLRLRSAQLLNFTNWADYTNSFNIAKSSKNVGDLLANLRSHVSPLGQSELDVANGLKANDTKIVSAIGDEDIVYSWDKAYYGNIHGEAADFDSDSFADYFPANVTVPAILHDIYGELFGIRFDRIQGQDADDVSPTGNGSDLVWHPDVQLYAVWNKQEYMDANGVTDPFIGFLYLDLFARPDVKSPGDGEMLFLIDGFVRPDGCREYPAAAALTGFDKANEDGKPSLIFPPTVLLHELGHCMHQLLSRATYAWTFGADESATPPDWAELPSLLMENWGKQPEALKKLSFHYSHLSPQAAAKWREEQGNATAALPPVTVTDDLIAEYLDSDKFYAGLDILRDIFYAFYDQSIYKFTEADVAAKTDLSVLFNRLRREIGLVPDFSDVGVGYKWGNGEALIDHFVSNSYGGNYYCYQWCQVYAEDVFYTAFASNLFDSAVGWRYRQQILQPGGSKDLKKMLVDFLGHEPSTDGYLEYLGISGT
ncbi:unnamed protein product [Zymoseptoria tritici ST99CH_1A5]|uniref:Peptidase M3A/M3B catalytic domain-containing protein n=2 Tax=Zymoseptoria tritici TaxID=1047171 RepID=A0A2H1FXS8_ZYMTR|nr:unnamed protein product [Zymoseptoria tritici ST99CH_1E4]SMY21261.1 unnamed protein product [Zymoseptoria tritici ST99CH_1A5]